MANNDLASHLVALARHRSLTHQTQRSRCAGLRSLIDTVGCIIAGNHSADPFLVRGNEHPGNSVILCREQLVSPAYAAFVNGYHAHFLDFDDSLYPAQTHPSAVIVPALFAAVGDTDVSGEQLLTAYTSAFELQGLLGIMCAQQLYNDGWWTTSLLGAPAAALAASDVLGLDDPTATNAVTLAIAASFGMKGCFGSHAKALGVGWASRGGIEAALLARDGFGGPSKILEDSRGFLQLRGVRNQSAHLRDALFLEQPGPTYKLYPTCTATHATIEAILSLLSDGLRTDDITSINVHVSRYVLSCLTFDRPQNPAEAQFSLQYAIAAALTYGEMGIRQLRKDFIVNPQIFEWYEKIQVVEEATQALTHEDMEGAGQEGAFVEIFDNRGNSRTSRVLHAKGQTLNPLKPSELNEKFVALTCNEYGPSDARRILQVLEDIPNIPSIRAVLSNLRASGSFEGAREADLLGIRLHSASQA